MNNYQNEYLLNLRNRINELTSEQKSNIKKVIENKSDHKTLTYNKNGLFVSMNDLSDVTLKEVKELLFLYEDINKFLKRYNPNPLDFY